MDIRERLGMVVGFMALSYWKELDSEDRTRKIGIATELALNLSDDEIARLPKRGHDSKPSFSCIALDLLSWVDAEKKPSWFDTAQQS